MENLLFAVVVGLTVFLLVRRIRTLKQQKQRRAEGGEPSGPPPEPATMPRLGRPGSITRDQIKQLRKNDFEPSRMWSREEAQLILDSVTYLRAVIFMATGEKDAPLEVQNRLLKFILTDEELREYVYDWSLNLARDKPGLPELPRDEAFARLEAIVLQQWERP